jgi:hypothetical protein
MEHQEDQMAFLDVRAQRPALAEDCGETGDLLQLPEASPRM